jgi:hypothetical protein
MKCLPKILLSYIVWWNTSRNIHTLTHPFTWQVTFVNRSCFYVTKTSECGCNHRSSSTWIIDGDGWQSKLLIGDLRISRRWKWQGRIVMNCTWWSIYCLFVASYFCNVCVCVCVYTYSGNTEFQHRVECLFWFVWDKILQICIHYEPQIYCMCN